MKVHRVYLVIILFFSADKAFSQNFINLNQAPLLFHPSRVGEDSNRVSFIYQNSDKTGVFTNTKTSDLYVSYDRLSKKRNLATGIYFLTNTTRKTEETNLYSTFPVRSSWESSVVNQSKLYNAGFVVSPKYSLHYLHLIHSQIVFQPSFMVTYSHLSARDVFQNKRLDVEVANNKLLQKLDITDSSVYASNRVTAYVGFMLKSSFLSFGYKLGCGADFATQKRSNRILDSASQSYNVSEHSYSSPFTFMSHSFTLSASLSKSDSSAFNFTPMLVVSFWNGLNFKKINGYEYPSLQSSYRYRISELSPFHLSLNFRFYRALFGAALTNGLSNVYLGYRFKYGTMIAGIGNGNISTGINVRF